MNNYLLFWFLSFHPSLLVFFVNLTQSCNDPYGIPLHWHTLVCNILWEICSQIHRYDWHDSSCSDGLYWASPRLLLRSRWDYCFRAWALESTSRVKKPPVRTVSIIFESPPSGLVAGLPDCWGSRWSDESRRGVIGTHSVEGHRDSWVVAQRGCRRIGVWDGQKRGCLRVELSFGIYVQRRSF